MSCSVKPRVAHPLLKRNSLGLTVRDYEGSMSTLCAGCGHDSVTAGIVRAFYELDIPPHQVAKMSGIGCSAKTPTYFLKEAHGFNGNHGRMPSLATGAQAANSNVWCIGISGDGDSLSIGLGQFCHAIRRNVNMLYVLENNGVYGLTKGQFSASADIGSKSKKGQINSQEPIDPISTALTFGATFVARCFSGDKSQLVKILKAGLLHKGFAIIDVISPCVTFNNHKGSTKSYDYTRDHRFDLSPIDFVSPKDEIVVSYDEGSSKTVEMHDGNKIRFHKVRDDYDPSDREAAIAYYRKIRAEGSVVTGLLYLDENSSDMHTQLGTIDEPLSTYPYENLCPGSDALANLMKTFK
jgi:2-oxoglutarate/2-oxoacid ferredoxin oxidoreductase subunit beta